MKKKEIGSDFHCSFQKDSSRKYLNINGIQSQKDYEFFISGRSAIRALAKNLKVDDKIILMPAFLCKSMYEPFEKEGWRIEFYQINIDLTIDISDINLKLDILSISAVFLMSYFGFNTTLNMNDLIIRLKSEGIIVIEDITHSMYSQFKKTSADFYVASLRKWDGIPEGGVILFGDCAIEVEKQNSDNKLTDTMLKASELKRIYLEEDSLSDKQIMREMFIKGKKLVDEYAEVFDISNTAKKMFFGMNCEVLAKRKENYYELKKGLESINWISLVFKDITKDIIPLYFPIFVRGTGKRDLVQKMLAELNIYCPVIWPQYIKNDKINKATSYIYDHILCIPCDQRYGVEEMRMIVEIIKKIKIYNEYPDIYYLKEWGVVNEQHDGGVYKMFEYHCEYGAVVYPMILRETPVKINGIQYFDSITPYGFNGPVFTNVTNKEELIINFKNALDDFCQENNIVSEYIRFSPWLKNAEDMKTIYKIKDNNKTFFIDLRGNFFEDEFSSKCRNIIRKAKKSDVVIEFDFKKEKVDEFLRLYEMMTVKNQVNSFYSFDKVYIKNLLEQMENHIFLAHAKIDNHYISSAMFLYDEDHIHYHLSGNDYSYTNLGANSLLLFEVASWAKSLNIKEFHLGGASHQTLYDFKKQFTKNGILPFYVGYRKSNITIYDKICEKVHTKESFFPAYR